MQKEVNMIKVATIYDLENAKLRKRYTRTFFNVVVIIIFIINVILIPLTCFTMAFVTEIYWLIFGVLLAPIGYLITCLISKLLLIPYGRTIDIANISINTSIIQKNISSNEHSIDDKEKIESPKTVSSVKTYVSNTSSTTFDTTKIWECKKCGYKNPGYVTECENCYSPRK